MPACGWATACAVQSEIRAAYAAIRRLGIVSYLTLFVPPFWPCVMMPLLSVATMSEGDVFASIGRNRVPTAVPISNSARTKAA